MTDLEAARGKRARRLRRNQRNWAREELSRIARRLDVRPWPEDMVGLIDRVRELERIAS